MRNRPAAVPAAVLAAAPVAVLAAALLALVSVAACDGGGPQLALPPPPLDTALEALGQPSGDFPSYAERVVLYASNRARMSPAAEGWPAYAPQPPLQWNASLNQSSRAHSVDMRDTPCFQHPSCGSATDDTFARVRTYYTGAARALGENIAGGPGDGITVVHNWIFEIGAPAGETGHRDNLFSAMFNLLGSGYAPGGMPRPAVNNFWTQDFVGTGAALALPRMTDGIHVAAVTGGPLLTFGTTYYDASGAAPDRIVVVVDGACNPLTLASAGGMPRGVAGKGAYEATLTLGPGCHPYYFLAGAGAGAASYPDSGALQAGVGAAVATTCPLFVPTRPPASCDAVGGGGGGDAGAGGGAGARGTGGGSATGTGGAAGGAGGASAVGGGVGGAAGAAGARAIDGSVGTGGGAGGAGASAGNDGAPATAGETGCACRAAPGGGGAGGFTGGAAGAGGLAAVALCRRRRRRAGARVVPPSP